MKTRRHLLKSLALLPFAGLLGCTCTNQQCCPPEPEGVPEIPEDTEERVNVEYTFEVTDRWYNQVWIDSGMDRGKNRSELTNAGHTWSSLGEQKHKSSMAQKLLHLPGSFELSKITVNHVYDIGLCVLIVHGLVEIRSNACRHNEALYKRDLIDIWHWHAYQYPGIDLIDVKFA